MRTASAIMSEIDQFQPQDDEWLTLDTLLGELWETGHQENFTTDLLRVFERFPEEDGDGVFWTILHGVETFASYETELVDSLNRQPSEMGLTMLLRIKKAGISTIGGVKIDAIARNVLSNGKMSPKLVRTFSEHFQP